MWWFHAVVTVSKQAAPQLTNMWVALSRTFLPLAEQGMDLAQMKKAFARAPSDHGAQLTPPERVCAGPRV